MNDEQRRLHIVLLSDLETEGGAVVAASRLAQGLCHAGHEVTRSVAKPDGFEHPWKTIVLGPAHPVRNQIVRQLIPGIWRKRWDEVFIRRRLEQALRFLRPDVINIHNLHWGPGVAGRPIWSRFAQRTSRRSGPCMMCGVSRGVARTAEIAANSSLVAMPPVRRRTSIRR